MRLEGPMLLRRKFLIVAALLMGTALASYLGWHPIRTHSPSDPSAVDLVSAYASTGGGGSFPAAQFLQAPAGGMAQYGYAMQQSSSSAQTLQALSDWNAYVNFRGEWSMTTVAVERLALADWTARQAGVPTITPEQLAAAATNLINNRLATMTAQQQGDLFDQMMVEVTPKLAWGLNGYFPHATATQNVDGTWSVTISPTPFSNRKADYQIIAPGMVSSYTNFYPGEAMLVAYSVAAADMGFGADFVSKVKNGIGDMTGLDMANRSLFGEQGYLRRRPLNTFLTEAAMSQLFSELGF